MEQRKKKWSIKNFFERKKENINGEKIQIEEKILDSSPYNIEVKEVRVKKIKIKE